LSDFHPSRGASILRNVQADSKAPAIEHAEGPQVGLVGLVSHFSSEYAVYWPGGRARTLNMYSFF
jgi:hypothetical protein